MLTLPITISRKLYGRRKGITYKMYVMPSVHPYMPCLRMCMLPNHQPGNTAYLRETIRYKSWLICLAPVNKLNILIASFLSFLVPLNTITTFPSSVNCFSHILSQNLSLTSPFSHRYPSPVRRRCHADTHARTEKS